MIPDMVRVGAVWYRVLRVSELAHKGKRRFGLWDAVAEELLIEAQLPPAIAYATYLHELIHAIDYDRGIGLTERQVDQVANGLAAVMWEGEGSDDGEEDSEPHEGADISSGVAEAKAQGRFSWVDGIAQGDTER